MAKNCINLSIGYRKGQIEIIKRADVKFKEVYICKCHACGNVVELNRQQIINPSRQSCGCLNTAKTSNQTLCWTCENSVPKIEYGEYTRGCNWSINKLPVEGWEAEPTRIKHQGSIITPSFLVKNCPQYIASKKEESRVRKWKKQKEAL